tara:strand:- start:56734 stop:57012 length:279 start_codon:yes stop_codon:yes gene_type:complete
MKTSADNKAKKAKKAKKVKAKTRGKDGRPQPKVDKSYKLITLDEQGDKEVRYFGKLRIARKEGLIVFRASKDETSRQKFVSLKTRKGVALPL